MWSIKGKKEEGKRKVKITSTKNAKTVDTSVEIENYTADEMATIVSSLKREYSIKNGREENAVESENKFLRNTRFDTIIIFLSTGFSICALLFHSVDLWFISIPLKVQVLLGFVLFGLFMSLSAIYDIIRSLFILNQLRYELSTKMEKVKSD